MINQVQQKQAGLQAGLQNHQRDCFCPFWSSLAPGMVQWLWVAWSHKPLCRTAGRENNPMIGSPQPQRHLPPSEDCTNSKAGEIYPLPRVTDQVTAPLVLPLALQQWRPCCPAQSPNWTGVMLDLAVQYLVSPHPQSAGQGGTELFGARIRQRMFSGQTEGGAQAGEAKFRDSLRELWRRHAARVARQGCQQVRGAYAHPTPLGTAAPGSAPPGQPPSTPGKSQHPPEHAASVRPWAGDFGWSPRGAPKNCYSS